MPVTTHPLIVGPYGGRAQWIDPFPFAIRFMGAGGDPRKPKGPGGFTPTIQSAGQTLGGGLEPSAAGNRQYGVVGLREGGPLTQSNREQLLKQALVAQELPENVVSLKALESISPEGGASGELAHLQKALAQQRFITPEGFRRVSAPPSIWDKFYEALRIQQLIAASKGMGFNVDPRHRKARNAVFWSDYARAHSFDDRRVP